MRFDDTLETVRASDLTTPASLQAAWRQIVDLVGRGRAPVDDWVVATLDRIRRDVPLPVRAASARALFGAAPPAALVRLLALDDIAVAAPVLRSATLDPADWIALLPELTPTARAVLRHRRDLPPEVLRGLSSYGPVDFVIGTDAVAANDVLVPAVPAPEPSVPHPVVPPVEAVVDPGPFVTVGSIALAARGRGAAARE